jgi:tight adherence protein B
MTGAQLPLLTFIGVAGSILGTGALVYELFFRYREEVGQRLTSEFGRRPSAAAEQTRLFKDFSKLAQQSAVDDQVREHPLERIIDQAGLAWSVRSLLAGSFALAAAAGLAGGFWFQWWLAGLAAFLLALPVPTVGVSVCRQKRLTRLRQQLPDAFETMSRTIRAGQTVTGAFQTVADDFEAPLSDEFAWCAEQQKLGLSQEIALRELAQRTGIPELQMLVVALLVQRQSGGSPVAMLDNLAAVVRTRIELQEKIATLTAEGRMQAAVLLLLPPLLLAAISFLNPEYVEKLWDRPMLLAGMLGSELVGIAWIRRILKLEF